VVRGWQLPSPFQCPVIRGVTCDHDQLGDFRSSVASLISVLLIYAITLYITGCHVCVSAWTITTDESCLVDVCFTLPSSVHMGFSDLYIMLRTCRVDWLERRQAVFPASFPPLD